MQTADLWIEISPQALLTSAAVEFVADPAAGGIDLFLGTTRAERNAAGDALLALHYEAYSEMALKQLAALAASARERFGVIRLALLHRIGRVDVGQPSVLIAVSAPHRAEAFDACRFLIDELKRGVAIWKKEVWAAGAATWVHPDHQEC